MLWERCWTTLFKRRSGLRQWRMPCSGSSCSVLKRNMWSLWQWMRPRSGPIGRVFTKPCSQRYRATTKKRYKVDQDPVNVDAETIRALFFFFGGRLQNWSWMESWDETRSWNRIESGYTRLTDSAKHVGRTFTWLVSSCGQKKTPGHSPTRCFFCDDRSPLFFSVTGSGSGQGYHGSRTF